MKINKGYACSIGLPKTINRISSKHQLHDYTTDHTASVVINTKALSIT